MEHKVRTAFAYIFLLVPLSMFTYLVASQPEVTANVTNELSSASYASFLYFWSFALFVALTCVAFYVYDKSITFQKKLDHFLHSYEDYISLLIRFSLSITLLVLIKEQYFSTFHLHPLFLAYFTVSLAVLLLFGVFTQVAALLGILLFIYTLTQNGFNALIYLSLLGGFMYLIYTKKNPKSFDALIEKNHPLTTNHEKSLTVLRFFQGLSLLALSYYVGFPFLEFLVFLLSLAFCFA